MDNSYTDLLGGRPETSVASLSAISGWRGGRVVEALEAFYGDLAALKPLAITSASLSPYLMATSIADYPRSGWRWCCASKAWSAMAAKSKHMTVCPCSMSFRKHRPPYLGGRRSFLMWMSASHGRAYWVTWFRCQSARVPPLAITNSPPKRTFPPQASKLTTLPFIQRKRLGQKIRGPSASSLTGKRDALAY